MKEALTVCATRGRVDKCKEMYASWIQTSSCSDIIFLLDDDDLQLCEYIEWLRGICNKEMVFYRIESRGTNIKRINGAYKFYPNYEYYHVTNDDFVYRTNGWDVQFKAILEEYGPGITYGNDLYMGEKLPVAFFISKEIIKSIGWLVLPTLHHLCGDMVWKYIGEKLNALYYCKNIIIDHKHPSSKNHKVEKDETFLYTNSKEMYQKDNEAYQHWLLNDSYDDIAKIKETINHENIK